MKQQMSEDEQYIFDSIYTQVRSGFYSLEEIQDNIIEEIEDNGFAFEISEEWAFTQIDNVYQSLLEESKSWPQPTATQRLILAFDELAEKHKIIALHYAGYDMSEGEYEVAEIERTLIENGEKSEGYCFYHGQDLERAVQKEGLYIAFQKIDNQNDSIAKDIAKKVIATLEKHGLTPEWNKKVNSRIFIPDFKWQHIFNEENRDLMNYNYVIDAILGNK